MSERARVTSVEVLERFRARLIVYLDKAGHALDDITDDVSRTRSWLAEDRRVHWERQVRQRSQELERRKQELFSAGLGGLREAPQEQRAAVQRARRALAEAENKRDRVRYWIRRYDSHVAPLARPVDNLRQALIQDMGKAVGYLNETLAKLREYADLAPLQTYEPETRSEAADRVDDAASPADDPREP